MSQPVSDFPGDMQSDFDAGFGESYDDGGMFQAGAQPGMEPQIASAAPVYRKQPFNIYSVMLILSFVNLLAATIILMIEAGKYN